MVLKERLKVFIGDRFGLRPNEVASVLGTFVAAKYAVWAGFLVVGVRFRPLSRLFRAAAPRVKAKLADRSPGLAEKVERQAAKVRRAKEDFQRFSGKGGAEATAAAAGPATLWEKAGARYRYYADKIATRIAANKAWTRFSGAMHQRDPKLFALGIAEGMILYKVTAPVSIPITLHGVVRYYKWRRGDGEGGDGGDDGGGGGGGGRGEVAVAASWRSVGVIAMLGTLLFGEKDDLFIWERRRTGQAHA